MIRLGSLGRDYSLFRGVITLDQGWRSQHGRYGCTIHSDRHDHELRTISASRKQLESVLTYYILGSLKLFQNFHGKTPQVLLKTVDLCLEMSSDFKCNFWSVAEQIFELRTTKSQCHEVRVQAHAKRKEPWINKRPTSDGRCSDWQRTQFDN